ncbi:hypothetical protein [Algoriphagus namhaensis]
MHSDIPEEQLSFGGGVGLAINLNNRPNRWQGQVNLDYFILDTQEASEHGFRRFSTMFQFGRIWSVKLNENTKLGIGGGLVGVFSLESKSNSWYGQNSLAAAGIYFRLAYPIANIQGKQVNLMLDNAVFGDGYMRNVFGISYPLSKK